MLLADINRFGLSQLSNNYNVYRNVTLHAIKSLNMQTKISQVRRKEMKNCKGSCYTVLKDLFN